MMGVSIRPAYSGDRLHLAENTWFLANNQCFQAARIPGTRATMMHSEKPVLPPVSKLRARMTMVLEWARLVAQDALYYSVRT